MFALLCILAGAAGWATSTLATGGVAVPGTTVTIPTNKDGQLDLTGVDIASLLGAVKLPNGMTLPAGVVPGAGTTVPPALSTPATTPNVTPSTATQPTTTTVTTTVPGVVPNTAVPNLFPTTTPTTTTTATAASNTTQDRLATVLLLVVGALLFLTALAFAVARLMGWEPDWWSGRRHQTAEAAWRTSNTWADFGDWVRRRT